MGAPATKRVFKSFRCRFRPAWLRVDRLLGEHGIQRDTPASRQEFERQMERRRLEELDPEALEAFRREWCLGGEAFRKKQLQRMEDWPWIYRPHDRPPPLLG